MIFKALALGFSTGIFCAGYCFPILGSFMLSKDETTIKDSAVDLGLFVLGRFIAYLFWGLCIGLIGQYTKGILYFQKMVIPGLFIILGGIMVLYGVIHSFPRLKLCNVGKKYFKKPWHLFVAGALAGISPCPPFLLATSYAVTLGEIWKSAVFFLFFFMATTVFLLPFLFSGVISRFKDVRIAARITAIIVGAWFIRLAVKSVVAT